MSVSVIALIAPLCSAFQLRGAMPHAPAPSARARVTATPMALLGIENPVETSNVPKTIGDAKTAFTSAYGRPVNGVQQGFVNEMLSSVALTVSSPAYKPNRVFYLGFQSLCKTFLEGSSSEAEQQAITTSLCTACGLDTGRLAAEAAGRFKYSYPLGAGLFALMPMVGLEVNDEVIERWCTELQLPTKKLQKDWAFFVDASEKLVEVRQMLMEMSAAAKRKEAQKLKEEADAAAKEADEAEAAAATAGES